MGIGSVCRVPQHSLNSGVTPCFAMSHHSPPPQKLDVFMGDPDLKRGQKYKAAFASGRRDKFWSMIVEKAYVAERTPPLAPTAVWMLDLTPLPSPPYCDGSYAKYSNKSYKSIEGGLVHLALVDLTAGSSELVRGVKCNRSSGACLGANAYLSHVMCAGHIVGFTGMFRGTGV
jgi:hypothetical protein